MDETLKAKVGQMFMVGFEGEGPSDPLLRLIQEYHIGGIVLFGRNVQTPAQVKELIEQLQGCARRAGANLPLLVAIDQEGGIVTRLTRGFTIFPGNMALGAIDSEELAGRVGEVMAREMVAMGINMNLAPVLDIHTRKENPGVGVRAYGDTPGLVARMGVAVLKAYQRSGIIATAKHFPGIGDADADTHLGLPSISHSRERLASVELYPFVAAIQAGVKAIMTSHVCFPALEPDPQLPATLSRSITETLLRRDLGFEGVVVTDDLEMGAILKHFNLAEAVVRAVEAGADLLLICRDYQRQIEGLEGLYRAVETGRIQKDRLSASFQRILNVKRELSLTPKSQPSTGEAIQRVGTVGHRKMAYEVARRAVTLVRDREGLIPLNLSRHRPLGAFYPKVFSLTQVEEGPQPVTLLSELRQRYPNALGFEFDTEPSPDQIRAACSVGKEVDLIVIASYNSHLKPLQKQLIQGLTTLHKPMVLMALRNPYDIGEFPEIGTCLALYDYHKASIVAGVQVLLGDVQAEGALPCRL